MSCSISYLLTDIRTNNGKKYFFLGIPIDVSQITVKKKIMTHPAEGGKYTFL